MKKLRALLVVATGLAAALYWAWLAPREQPPAGLPLAAVKAAQCLGGSEPEGASCRCPTGSAWTGTLCASGPDGPDTRHVTTVDLRRQR
jgi:hypothetical protein